MLDIAKQKIRQLVLESSNADDATLGDDTELLISGLLDSLAVIRVATTIEQSLNLEVPPLDITIENFESLDAIFTYMAQRLKTQ